jgi:hypothetical protein
MLAAEVCPWRTTMAPTSSGGRHWMGQGSEMGTEEEVTRRMQMQRHMISFMMMALH